MNIKNCVISILAFITALLSFQVLAETIISSVTPPTGGGCLVIYNGQGFRVGWTQADTFDTVRISATLETQYAGITGQAYLTTQIGPGTTVANEIASTNFTFPLQQTDFVLFEGLHLPAGSYYLSIIGDSALGSCWEDPPQAIVTTGASVSCLGGFGASAVTRAFSI
jgi:hypothetical protein